MNKLPRDTRIELLSMLCEGLSMKAIARALDLSHNTLAKLVVNAGDASLALHQEKICGVQTSRVWYDYIWSFSLEHTKLFASSDWDSDAWTWTASDADSKLIIAFIVGDQSHNNAATLAKELRTRLSIDAADVWITGPIMHLEAVKSAFDNHCSRTNGESENLQHRGVQDEQSDFLENLTDASQRRVKNHLRMLAIYFVFYNFVRANKRLRMTPAMAAGLATAPWTMGDLVDRVDDFTAKRKTSGLGRAGPAGASH